jgi:hypothetical protein
MVEERFHRDDEDRPLREGRTPAEFLREGEIEYRACPYSGSRRDRVMNVSALRQTSAHWDEIVAALGFLRAAYAEARGGFGPDVMDVWRVSQLGSALPWYFVLRGEPLPAYAAALSKATLGTGILAQRLLHKMLREAWAPPPLNTEALRALAESTGTLVGETEVCAAPDKMIARFLDALVAGAARPGIVDHLIAERDRVLAFGACYAQFKLALWLYFQARRFLYADVAAAAPRAADRDAMIALLAAPCEPPDFFVIEPPDLAAVPPALRAAWLAQLAGLIAPFAPDGSDQIVRDRVVAMAAAMADADGAPVARACRTFDRLDALFAEVVAGVEAGLRGTQFPPPGPISAHARDRLLAASPRAAFAALRADRP